MPSAGSTRAYDPQLKRAVALKVAKSTGDSWTSSAAGERFLREAEAAANLRHPNIVAVFDSGEDGTRLFIASDFIRGQTLEARLKEGRLEQKRAVAIVRRSWRKRWPTPTAREWCIATSSRPT